MQKIKNLKGNNKMKKKVVLATVLAGAVLGIAGNGIVKADEVVTPPVVEDQPITPTEPTEPVKPV